MKVLDEQALREKLAEKSGRKIPESKAGGQNKQEAGKALHQYFLSLLARREYSRQELKNKAKVKGFNSDLVEQIIEEFVRENLQSDGRFCEMLIRSRIIKESGPFKIRMELKQKGVEDSVIENAISEADCDWFEMAKSAASKKTSNWKSKDAAHKAKLMRFLQSRGFDGEQVRFAVEECGF